MTTMFASEVLARLVLNAGDVLDLLQAVALDAKEAPIIGNGKPIPLAKWQSKLRERADTLLTKIVAGE